MLNKIFYIYFNLLLSELFFSSFLGTYILRQALFIYRLRVAIIPSYFKIEILAIGDELVTQGYKGLMISSEYA